LRAAIEEGNALTSSPAVQIYTSINIPSGTYLLTLGELVIRNRLVINGSDAANSIIDGGGKSRIFSIGGAGLSPTVDMQNLTIRNGEGGDFVNGGGIFINQGSTLNLAFSVVRNNRATLFGGGISNAGSLFIRSSTIRDNQVPTDGGGGQTASGGGILNFSSGYIKISRSTISGNLATRGGGIRNAGGQLDISNSTISGNRATNRGGGIMTAGELAVSFSTITNNEANAPFNGLNSSEDRFGGGIYSDRGKVTLTFSILAGNLDNRGRLDPGFAPDCYSVPPENAPSPSRFINSAGSVVGVSNANCELRAPIPDNWKQPNQVGTPTAPLNPQLAPLADNGGPTQTHALLPGSPAIDSASFSPAFNDQRGLYRGGLDPAGIDGNGDGIAAPDAGAYEVGAFRTDYDED
jgi:hypothetical protein